MPHKVNADVLLPATKNVHAYKTENNTREGSITINIFSMFSISYDPFPDFVSLDVLGNSY